jgi:hypothetical protein
MQRKGLNNTSAITKSAILRRRERASSPLPHAQQRIELVENEIGARIKVLPLEATSPNPMKLRRRQLREIQQFMSLLGRRVFTFSYHR